MEKAYINRYVGALTLAALLIVPMLAFAAQFRAEEQPSLSSGETVNDDLYMAGGVVTSSGDVRGDLVAGGGSVLVSGAVSSDLIVGGGNITILGAVGDDVRAGGGNIIVSGDVGGDIVAGGGQIQLTGKNIGGDVAIGGGSVRIDSSVGGDVKVGGGDVYINGPVAGNVELDADKITLGPNADIGGNLTYTSVKEATLEEGAVVRGETDFTARKARGEMGGAALAGIFTLALLAKFLMLFVGALILLLIFRKYPAELVERAMDNPLREMGRGVVFLIVTPVVSVVLLVSVIGIPLGALGLLVFGAAMVFASLVAPIILGSIAHRWIFKPSDYQVSWKTILLGVALYILIGIIPIIGWIAKLVLIVLALGAMLNIKWAIAKEWR
ncbi:MAG: FapA family protein [Patescibacteria group bacterium]|nr:FapA family protein [Patescibacteria group bacterium]